MKKILKIMVVLVLFMTVDVRAKLDFDLQSNNAVLYNLNDDEILYEKNISEKISIASLTKIMTAIVAIEKIDDLNAQVVLTSSVFEGLKEENASVAGFIPSEVVTYNDLLYGLMLPSGADAARALALNLSGSVDKFVEAMNEKAHELNMTNTHFVNENGLDVDDHYSTIEDMLVLMKYVLKNEKFVEVFTTRDYTTSDNKLNLQSTIKKNGEMYNINTDYIVGGKTGYTDNAGLCLASFARNDKVTLILITARAPYETGYPFHINDAFKVYDYMFNNYDYVDIVKEHTKVKSIDVLYSTRNHVEIEVPNKITKYVNKNNAMENVKIENTIVDKVSYKDKLNTNLGNIKIYYENKLVEEIPVTLTVELKIDYLKYITAHRFKFIGILSAVLFVLIILGKLIKH